MAAWDEVLSFWFEELEPGQWFEPDPAVDAEITRRFGALHARLLSDVPDDWRRSAHGVLAAVIVLDQFSRQIHRGDARAFAGDQRALALVKDALVAGFDMRLNDRERQFLYMPLMHSERLADQERCIELMEGLELDEPAEFARRHAAVIARFGRFPARNDALGRRTTEAEARFLEEAPQGF